MSKIEQELMKATGVKPNKDRPKFLAALLKGANALTDTAWEKLSEPAGKWINLANKAVEKEKEIPELPADKAEAKAEAKPKAKAEAKEDEDASDTEEGDAEEGDDEGEDDKPKAKAEAKPKAAAAKPAAKVAAKKGPGKLEKLKVLILKNLKSKPEDLKAKVTAAGIEVSDSTITTVRSDFLSTVRVLQKAGKLSGDLVDLG